MLVRMASLLTCFLLPLAAGLLHGASPSTAYADSTFFCGLDAGSGRFKSVQADVKYDSYTRIVKDHDLSSGTIYIERTGNAESMGAIITSQGNHSPDKILEYGGGVLQIFSPGTNQDDLFKAGANQAKYEGFLTLGFGVSCRDLTSQWIIDDQGAETVDGVKTEKLDLVSKDPGVKSTFTHVTLWIDPARDISLKQIFYAPNGDTRTTFYTNIRMNDKIDKAKYSIPKSAKKISH